MKRFLMVGMVLAVAVSAFAGWKCRSGTVNGWGYCWKCSCNQYQAPFGGGDPCRNCGHSYNYHYNVNRP